MESKVTLNCKIQKPAKQISEYELAKSGILRVHLDPIQLKRLKDYYDPFINSIRHSKRIQSLADLVECLEQRDILSEYNTEPLHRIATYIQNEHNETPMVMGVTDAVPPKSLINEYAQQRLAEDTARQLRLGLDSMKLSPSPPSSSLSASCEQDTSAPSKALQGPQETKATFAAKRNAIYKLLASEIGRGWRSFGRELDIGEGIMDEIEHQHRDLPSCIYRILQMAEEDEQNRDPYGHMMRLCHALDGCRRKDLRRKLERMHMSP